MSTIDLDQEHGVIRIVSTSRIARPPRDVFDYVTTPALWPTWHPATAAVRDVPNRPLVRGETAVETIVVAGRRSDATWTVEACDPPHRWVIATTSTEGRARIVYRLSAEGAGTRFERTLLFRSARRPWRWLDSTFLRWVLERQSRRALAQLQAVLEARSVERSAA